MINKCYHWLKINRIVVRRAWLNLSIETRDAIAADALHLTENFKWFTAHCEAETNRLFEDAEFHYNNPVYFSNPRN
jgi:hypothetical protein